MKSSKTTFVKEYETILSEKGSKYYLIALEFTCTIMLITLIKNCISYQLDNS